MGNWGYNWKTKHCWWFRNPVNSPVEVGSVSHYLQGFRTIPGGCLGFLNHQPYVIVQVPWNTRTILGMSSFKSHTPKGPFHDKGGGWTTQVETKIFVKMGTFPKFQSKHPWNIFRKKETPQSLNTLAIPFLPSLENSIFHCTSFVSNQIFNTNIPTKVGFLYRFFTRWIHGKCQ